MKTRFFLASALAFSMFSCQNEPSACFTPATALADMGEPIQFQNCSFFAETYAWEFGDGATSTEVYPVHSFANVGEYLVLLTITNSRGAQSDTHSEIVKVGERQLDYIDVNSVPADNAGTPWDAVGDPADLQLFMKPSSSGTWSFSTPENTNMALTPPYIWNLSTSAYMFTHENWDFLLLDNDAASADTVGTWTIDLNQALSNRAVTLTGTSTEILAHYKIK